MCSICSVLSRTDGPGPARIERSGLAVPRAARPQPSDANGPGSGSTRPDPVRCAAARTIAPARAPRRGEASSPRRVAHAAPRPAAKKHLPCAGGNSARRTEPSDPSLPEGHGPAGREALPGPCGRAVQAPRRTVRVTRRRPPAAARRSKLGPPRAYREGGPEFCLADAPAAGVRPRKKSPSAAPFPEPASQRSARVCVVSRVRTSTYAAVGLIRARAPPIRARPGPGACPAAPPPPRR